ncbi:MAG: protein kinase [Polyangiaceae bacterium]|nr:protein kinase [Polyangiaceae bacterium]
MHDAPSHLRGDRYAVIRLLGEGGQAATFEAVDKKEGKPVAIKRFRVRGAKSWKEVELAEREARVLSSLSHPGLPRYVEHFEENGELFLVTEKVEGESLAAMQKRGATLDEGEIVRFLRDSSAILDYLHGRAPPVVHRDVKPSNILRRPDGSFVIIDFGAVRDKLKPEGGSTVVGTFGFMAPEQFQGRAMPASDVYAVGATAMTMLTGVQPEDLPHKGLAIDVASALGKNASPTLVSALAAMLEPDPDRRATRIAPLIETLRDAPRKTDVPRDKPRRGAKPSKKERDIERDIEQGIEEAVQQMEQGFSEIKKEWAKKSKKHESKANRDARKAEEKAARRARKAEQRARKIDERAWAEVQSSTIPVPVAGLLLFGLTIAQIAVLVALRAIVPTLLSVLSIFFGKPLRDASARTRDAGVLAHESMQRAKDVVRNRTERTSSGARIEVKPVETPSDPKRVRIADADAKDDAAEDELAAEEEADAEARARQRK